MRVLFVSKPIAPPWNDGSKNLVRDVATHLTRAEATVMTTRDAPSIGARAARVYARSGSFAPTLSANARVLARLVVDRDHDVWHFVFAPNSASTNAARIARALGRFRGAVVQTVASRPSTDSARLFFGDEVIALTEWTRARIAALGVRALVIPPCVPRPAPISAERIDRVRARVGEGPIVLYPGDYEVSSGARTVADADFGKDARVVFACRQKSPRANEARAALSKENKNGGVHLGEVDDMAALLAAASVVVFPVDDLRGKIDLPLVLLEALARDVPLVLARGGPLEEITTARFVDPRDPSSLAREARAAIGERQGGEALYAARFTPERVAAMHDDLYDAL